MNCLITGGAGFVGSYLAEALINLEHTVTIIDNYSTGRLKNIQNLHVEVKHQDVSKITTGIDKYDVVFHLAAKPFSKAKTDWFSESNSIFHSNVVGTYNILRLMNPKCHFIFTSSASVYGEGRKIEENSRFHPQSAYGYSKMMAEQIIINSPRQHTIVRPATIIGPRGRCFPNRVMWSLVHNKQCKFFKNGEILRDMIDVNDVVSALIKIMDTKTHGIFNLGSNLEITGKQLMNIAKEFKPNIKFHGIYTPFVPQDFVAESTLMSDKLYQALNWKPETTLLKSLNNIYDYYFFDKTTTEPPNWSDL